MKTEKWSIFIFNYLFSNKLNNLIDPNTKYKEKNTYNENQNINATVFEIKSKVENFCDNLEKHYYDDKNISAYNKKMLIFVSVKAVKNRGHINNADYLFFIPLKVIFKKTNQKMIVTVQKYTNMKNEYEWPGLFSNNVINERSRNKPLSFSSYKNINKILFNEFEKNQSNIELQTPKSVNDYFIKAFENVKEIVKKEIDFHFIESEESLFIFKIWEFNNFDVHLNDLRKHILKNNDENIKLFDKFIKANNSTTPKEEVRTYPYKPRNNEEIIKYYFNDVNMGLFKNNFTLSYSQRVALISYLESSKNQDIFSINGPPGTGKTTLIQNIVANSYVSDYNNQKDPIKSRLSIGVSKNNQAISNILETMDTSDNKDGLGTSWITNSNSIGLVASSKAPENIDIDHIKDIYFKKKSPDEKLNKIIGSDTDKKWSLFIENFLNYFSDTDSENITKDNFKLMETTLNNEIIKMKKRIKSINKIFKEILSYEHIENELNLVMKKIEEAFSDNLFLFNHANKRFLKIIKDFSNDKSQIILNKINKLNKRKYFFGGWRTKKLIKKIRNKFKEINEKNKNNEKLFIITKTSEMLDLVPLNEKEIKNLFTIKELKMYISNELDKITNVIDTTYKYQLFWLCFHFNELLFLKKVDSWWDTDGGEIMKVDMLRLLAAIKPMIVSSINSIPKFFKDNKGFFKAGEIDQLFFDESGQITIEDALPVLSLTKKTIAFGDELQLQPIHNQINEIDFQVEEIKDFYGGNLSEKDSHNLFNKMSKNKLLKGDASFLSLVNKVSPFKTMAKNDNLQLNRGLWLLEHRRCQEKIIQFSNKNFYNRMLNIMTPKKESLLKLDSISYSIIMDDNKCANSSQKEASKIVEWILKNKETISKMNSKNTLGESLAIVTPYREQEKLLKKLLKISLTPKEFAGITIGTIHSLQGAEKDVVIFSMAKKFAKENNPVFIEASLINVAITRAKNHFICFWTEDPKEVWDDNSKKKIRGIANKLKLYLIRNGEKIIL